MSLDQKELAAISTALFLYLQGDASSVQEGILSPASGSAMFNPWQMKFHVMRPQPIKTTYLKPVKK